MDDLIDRALASYVSAESRPGLEQRLLARAMAPRRRSMPWLLAGAPGAAALVLYVAQALSPVHPPGGTGFQPVHEIQAKPQAPVLVAKASPVHRARRRRRAPLPKLNIFPVITPIPEAEISLARLASANPQLASSLVAQPATGDPAPITIQPLSIEALEED